jgi:hypothetical protein
MRPQDMHDFLVRRYSRRSMFKGAAALSAVAGAGPLLWRQTTASAGTPAIGPRWIGFGAEPTTQMYVAWASGSARGSAPAPRRPMVRWGADASYGNTATAATGRVPVPAAPGGLPADNTFYSNLELRGLTPGRTYHYGVSNDGLTWSPDAVFTTGSAGQPNFRFTAFGDQYSRANTSVPMVEMVAALRPAFHLVAGDLAYANSLGGIAEPRPADFHPASWDSYLAAIGSHAAAGVPWHPAVGAHEPEPLDEHGYAGFVTRFPQSYDRTSGSPVVRSFRYGNVAFIQLDGNDLSAQETANTGYSQGAQTTWLAGQLARFRADGSGVDFIVVVCNCCCYSSNTNHGSDGGVRDAWAPLYDRYAVDLVISGHVHAYERTHPMRAGQPTRSVASGGTVEPGRDGTTYVCAGGGGDGLYAGWFGPTAGGDAGRSSAPRIWRWSGGDTRSGGSGRPENVTDTARDFSAHRRAVYSCLVVDVLAPTVPGGPTSLTVQAVMPAQKSGGVTNISSRTVIDSVTLLRTSHQPS